MTSNYRIASGKEGGTGSFLCPPGHPRHTYSLHGYDSPRHRNPFAILTIDDALTNPDVPDSVRARVQRIMDKADLVESEAWIRSVYGYFRNMYAPENGNLDASQAVNDPTHTLPAKRHLAVMHIQQYFPKHEPRADLIADAGNSYGSWPCVKCGQRVQYEAKFDALAVFGSDPKCPQGGTHER